MHFFGWPGISKICIFLGKMHIFQDPGLEKNVYTHFFQKNGKIPPICIFPRKMHIFVAQTLTQKMHIHLWCFFGGEKNAYTQFPENLYMHFLGWPGISKICIFLYFSGYRAGKKCISAFFQKKLKNSTDMHFFRGKCMFLQPKP